MKNDWQFIELIVKLESKKFEIIRILVSSFWDQVSKIIIHEQYSTLIVINYSPVRF